MISICKIEGEHSVLSENSKYGAFWSLLLIFGFINVVTGLKTSELCKNWLFK